MKFQKNTGNPNFAEMKSMAEFSNQKRKQIVAESFKTKTEEKLYGIFKIKENITAELNNKNEI